MHPLERKKILSDIATSWISLIGVGVAVYLGLFQYYSYTKAAVTGQQRATLDFARDYSEPGMYQARAKVEELRRDLAEAAMAQAETSVSQDEVAGLLQSYTEDHLAESIGNNGIYAELRLLVGFFDRIWICVEVGICDRSSAREFFQNEAYRFRSVFEPYLRSVRLTEPGFGDGIFGLSPTAVEN